MIYEIDYQKQQLTFCQAPLRAPAAIQLLDWLISYGVKEVIAIGNAGALIDIDENMMLVPNKAIRDEGTSFIYSRHFKMNLIMMNVIGVIDSYLKGMEIAPQILTH